MNIRYDVEQLPERKTGGKESEELLALKAFLAGTQRNMVIEYEEEKSAKNRYGTLRKKVIFVLKPDFAVWIFSSG